MTAPNHETQPAGIPLKQVEDFPEHSELVIDAQSGTVVCLLRKYSETFPLPQRLSAVQCLRECGGLQRDDFLWDEEKAAYDELVARGFRLVYWSDETAAAVGIMEDRPLGAAEITFAYSMARAMRERISHSANTGDAA